jgi:hypothetical protein
MSVAAALEYAKSGWPVFPCNPTNKQPYTPKGFKDASTDPKQVAAWWSKHPNAMIGMPTGAASGVWVVDVDVKPNAKGAEELADLEKANGALPKTVVASTPSGGTHYYFGYVDGIGNRGGFKPGIDVRGEGGYVILPGSVRHDGCLYEWESKGAGVASAPDWLLHLVERPKEKPRAKTAKRNNSSYTDAAITSELQKLIGTSSNRNNQLNDSAMAIGQFVGAGAISRQEAEERLYGAAIANGYVAKDGELAARATIKSGLDAGERQPRDIPEADELPEADPAWIAGWLKRRKAANDNQRFQITWFDDVNKAAVKSEILEGVLGEGEFSVLVAKPGTGKSVLAVDIGCHIAGELEWHGRAVRQGLVVFYAAERKALTERRIAAWAKRHGVSNIPFVVVGGKLDLTTGLGDANALAKAIAQLEQKCGQSCNLIILDTLTRTFGPGDQHQSKDMTRYIQSVDALHRATTAHVLVIHHSPWSEDRGKGAIDLDGAVDVSFVVTAKGAGQSKVFTLACTGSNDGEDGAITTFKLENVVLGTDDDGNETGAPVVVQVDAKPEAGSHVDMAYESLEQEIGENGQQVPDGSPGFPDGTFAVTAQVWRERFYADCGTGVADDTLRKRFERAVKALLETGRVAKTGEWYWLPDMSGTPFSMSE